jgi:hypothetical protein
MKSNFSKIILGVLIFFNMNANASSFKGYKRQPAGEILKYTETVERFSETNDDFLILISRHAALYRFPKSVGYADQVRDYLNSRMRAKKLLSFEVDPTTAEILNISDIQK